MKRIPGCGYVPPAYNPLDDYGPSIQLQKEKAEWDERSRVSRELGMLLLKQRLIALGIQ